MKNVDFRSKKYGWSTHSIRVELQNGRQYNSHYYTDPFFHGFFDHCFLRKCCYQCRFKNAHRADITLADYWRYRDVEGLRNDCLLYTSSPRPVKRLRCIGGSKNLSNCPTRRNRIWRRLPIAMFQRRFTNRRSLRKRCAGCPRTAELWNRDSVKQLLR